MYYKTTNKSFTSYGKGGNKVTIPRLVVQKVLKSDKYKGIEVKVNGHSYQFTKDVLEEPDLNGNKEFEIKYGEFKGKKSFLDNYLVSRCLFVPDMEEIVSNTRKEEDTIRIERIEEFLSKTFKNFNV